MEGDEAAAAFDSPNDADSFIIATVVRSFKTLAGRDIPSLDARVWN
jgi:hypothetical protein